MSELSDLGRTFFLLLLITSLGVCFVWAFWELEQVRDRRRRRVAAMAKRWILLVVRFSQIEGYKCLSLTRALDVVKCQLALM
jgi:hypothetical protein